MVYLSVFATRPVEVFRRVARCAEPDLGDAFTVDEAFLGNAPEGRAVGDLLAEHVIVHVGVGIDVDDAQPAVLAVQGPLYRQHNGVIAAHGERAAAVGDDRVVRLLDDVDAGLQVEGVNGNVADVRHLQTVEGRRPRSHVVRPDEGRLGADGAGSETRTAHLLAHSQPLGIEGRRRARESGEPLPGDIQLDSGVVCLADMLADEVGERHGLADAVAEGRLGDLPGKCLADIDWLVAERVGVGMFEHDAHHSP